MARVWQRRSKPTGPHSRLFFFEEDSTMEEGTLPLVRAAARLQLGYRATLDAILRGDLKGHQDARGRWFVSLKSIRRFAQERRSARVASSSTR